MALQLTEDELREVSLALSAYREILARDASGPVKDSLQSVDSVRRKIAAEWACLLANGRELRKPMAQPAETAGLHKEAC